MTNSQVCIVKDHLKKQPAGAQQCYSEPVSLSVNTNVFNTTVLLALETSHRRYFTARAYFIARGVIKLAHSIKQNRNGTERALCKALLRHQN